MRYKTPVLLLICVLLTSSFQLSDSIDNNSITRVSKRHLREYDSDSNGVEKSTKQNSIKVQKKQKHVEYEETKKDEVSVFLPGERQRKPLHKEIDTAVLLDSPEIEIKIKEKRIHSVNFTVAVSTPSTVWCKPIKRNTPYPAIETLKMEEGHAIQKWKMLRFDRLHSSTFYFIVCYAESSSGTPMKQALKDTSVEFKTKLNTAAFVIPAITVEKMNDQIALHLLSEPSKPTICHLYLMDNQLIDSIPIDLANWNATYYFNRIDIHSRYKVSCGMGDDANLQSTQFEFYTGVQYIEATPTSMVVSIMKALVVVGLVGLAGFAGYSHLRNLDHFQQTEKEKEPEEEKLLTEPSLQLSSETTAILSSLQPVSWRCPICTLVNSSSQTGQYLNDESAINCIMCHSTKDGNQANTAVVDIQSSESEEDFSDFDIQPTNAFAAQTVVPKEPPKIVRAAGREDSSEESEEEVPEVPKVSKVSKIPEAPKTSEVPEALKVEKPAGETGIPAAKPIPMKLRSAPTGAKSSIVIKKPASSTSNRPIRTKAKPAVIKVTKQNDDLFSELGMNAEVKGTKRITRIPRNPQDVQPVGKSEELLGSSSEISSDGWGDNDLNFSDCFVCWLVIYLIFWENL